MIFWNYLLCSVSVISQSNSSLLHLCTLLWKTISIENLLQDWRIYFEHPTRNKTLFLYLHHYWSHRSHVWCKAIKRSLYETLRKVNMSQPWLKVMFRLGLFWDVFPLWLLLLHCFKKLILIIYHCYNFYQIKGSSCILHLITYCFIEELHPASR